MAIAERQLDLMARQVGHLSRLVEDLLDVSRVSRGRIELRRERLVVERVLTDSVEAARPLIESRQQKLELTLPDEEHWVEADQVRLSQIFSNLLHNATKYTDPGGHIRVSLTTEAGEAVISFADDGIGIESGALTRIFDLFVQAPTAGRAQAGIGIGLTLVRALVKLHAGSSRRRGPDAGVAARSPCGCRWWRLLGRRRLRARETGRASRRRGSVCSSSTTTRTRQTASARS